MRGAVRRGEPASRAWIALRVVVVAVYAFMLGPILITAAVSFNASNRSLFPPRGFSLQWWGRALSWEWIDPLLFSLKLGLAAGACSTLLALPLAFALVRHHFRGRTALLALTLGPLLLPALVTGVGLLQLFQYVGLRDSSGCRRCCADMWSSACRSRCAPPRSACRGLPPNLEHAAASLGAPPWRVLAHVVLPLIKSGIVAGAVFAFIHSFTDVNLSLFLARPGETPINVKILGFLEFGFAPTLAAVSVLTIAIPLALVIALQRATGLGDFLYAERRRD